MANPGVVVKSRASRAARGEPTDTGVWFAVGFAEAGPVTPTRVVSVDDFRRLYGDRVSYSQLYDALEVFFSEGGAEAYISRVVGNTPAFATRTLVDRAGSPLNTLRVDAKYYGSYANSTGTRPISVTVQAPASGLANAFDIIIKSSTVEVERYPDLISPADAASRITAASEYVTVTNLGSATVAPNNNPAIVADATMLLGSDDNATASDTNWQTAIDRFTPDYGPGQVSMPGRSTTAALDAVTLHAMNNNRTALLDSADQAAKTALYTSVDGVKSDAGGPYAALVGSWVEIPPVSGTTSVRAVPGSAFMAGVIARVDRLEGTAGAAAAGQVSQAQFVTGVRQPTVAFTEQDYTDLNGRGVIMLRNFRNRGIMAYGFRSVSTDADWRFLTATRLRMSLTAKLNAVAQGFVFRTVDGRGHLFAELEGALSGVCKGEWEAGALYGDSPEEAFSVEVAAANTDTTLQNGELRAIVAGRFSAFAELVIIEIIKVPISGTV